MTSHGKSSDKLAAFQKRIAEVKRRERELSIERNRKQRELGELRARRREAEVESEMLVLDGQPVPKASDISKLQAEIATAEAEAEDDRWSPRIEACERKRAQLEAEREQFARDHADDLLGELVPAEVEATEELRRSLAAVLEAHVRRAQVAGDLNAVVRLLPPPIDGSTYRLHVRSDDRMQGFASEVRRAMDALNPLSPAELLPSDDELGVVA